MRLIFSISRKLFLTLFAVLLLSDAFAQPGGGGDPGDGRPVPIQGLLLLLLAGAFLGIKKLLYKKQQ